MKSGHVFRVSFPHLLVFILYCGYSNTQLTSVKQGDPHVCVFEDVGERSVYRCCNGYYFSNSTCIGCHDGRYGSDCSYYCSCQNGGTCNKIDGSCQCPPSHYGAVCAFPCPCKNGGTCNDDEGVFQSCTCKDGYYGNICENKCSCPDGIVCDPVSGCQCEHGTWGVNCSEVCHCPTNKVCDIADGSCICPPGFHGDKCQHQCDCFNGGVCSKANRNVCDCSSTWRGLDCTDCNIYKSVTKPDGKRHEFCEDKCLHCYNGNDCIPENKTCICTPGWHGDRCDKQCETGYYGYNCSEKCPCESFELCNQVTGECSCHSGYFGPSCNQTCPENCLECKKDTGDCASYVTGWIGTNFEPPQSSTVDVTNCTDVNGKCICTESCRQNCTNGTCDAYEAHSRGTHTLTIVLPAICCFVFVAVIPASWIYSRYRTKNRRSRNKQRDQDYAINDSIQMRQRNNNGEGDDYCDPTDVSVTNDDSKSSYVSLGYFSRNEHQTIIKGGERRRSELVGVADESNVSQLLNCAIMPRNEQLDDSDPSEYDVNNVNIRRSDQPVKDFSRDEHQSPIQGKDRRPD